MRQRPYSIRTRIKTCIDLVDTVNDTEVRDHIPLEQGLRQTTAVKTALETVSETIFH